MKHNDFAVPGSRSLAVITAPAAVIGTPLLAAAPSAAASTRHNRPATAAPSAAALAKITGTVSNASGAA